MNTWFFNLIRRQKGPQYKIKTFSAYAENDADRNRSVPQADEVHPAIRFLAAWLRRLGRGAMVTSFVVGFFAGRVAHAKLGFMILLPAGMILIAAGGYLVKQIKFYRFRLAGREAQLFALVVGGCALIALIQVLVKRFILHTV